MLLLELRHPHPAAANCREVMRSLTWCQLEHSLNLLNRLRRGVKKLNPRHQAPVQETGKQIPAIASSIRKQSDIFEIIIRIGGNIRIVLTRMADDEYT